MTKHNISRFIKDYLENKLTAKQNAKLETWYLLKAEENKTVDPPIEYEALEDKIWSKIVSEISQPEPKSPEVKKLAKVYKGIVSIGIAASLLMIAGVGYLIFNKNAKADDQYVIAKHYDLAPGTDKAVLTLSDGRNIDLGKDSSGKIATEAGVVISKTSDGTLVYKISGKNIPTAGFNTVKTPVGGQYMVILPDGTKVWLNAGSSLKYPTFLLRAEGRWF
ncbi:hypothetical protein [Pedobacter sp. P26]|uniref:hypothetical protein n=1 Tax=Pedobacter sp. P26 TaxID=3423956 RepID=UPI003D67F2BB